MRVVNLSRKPFLNRRPVARIALLLWVLGGLLLAANAGLYATYLSGTTKNRALLAEIDAEIESEEAQLDAAVDEVRGLDLGERNLKARFLNELIARRTFPWSRLFDDLEDILLDDIYLESVAPKIQDSEPKARRTSRRTITPQEARQRQRRQQSGEARAEGPEGPAAASDAAEDIEYIELALTGMARTDTALLEFVDVLYRSDRFVDPFLSQETRTEAAREVRFSITAYYLLPSRANELDEAVQLAEADGGSAGTKADEEPMVQALVPDAGAGPAVPSPSRGSASGSTPGAPARGADGDGGGARTPQATQDQRAEDLRDVERRRADRRTDPATTDPSRPDRQGRGAEDRGRIVGLPGAPATSGQAGGGGAGRPVDPAADGADPGNGPPRPGGAEPPPELTEPDASASPSLRRIGRLELPAWYRSERPSPEVWA